MLRRDASSIMRDQYAGGMDPRWRISLPRDAGLRSKPQTFPKEVGPPKASMISETVIARRFYAFCVAMSTRIA